MSSRHEPSQFACCDGNCKHATPICTSSIVAARLHASCLQPTRTCRLSEEVCLLVSILDKRISRHPTIAYVLYCQSQESHVMSAGETVSKPNACPSAKLCWSRTNDLRRYVYSVRLPAQWFGFCSRPAGPSFGHFLPSFFKAPL